MTQFNNNYRHNSLTNGTIDGSTERRVYTNTAPTETKDIVAIVGLGYVGLPLALLAERRGYPTIGIDIDTAKVKKLQQRIAPYLSESEQEMFKESSLFVSGSGEKLTEADTVIICVPTPVHKDHTPDLSPLISAATIVGKHLREGQLIIIESTVNPGVCEDLVLPLLEKHSHLKAGEDFSVAHAPERINPGDPDWDVSTISRVIGANDEESLRRGVQFYESILNADVVPMKSMKEAEAVKVVENSFRDINIAFVNELAMSFDKLGIDVVNVIRGASSKPFAFMPHFPGCGVGGHCIPVDPYYLIDYAAQNGFKHRFLSLAREINNTMPEYTVDLLEKEMKKAGLTLRGSTIALLGISYKKDIPDMRESPAIEILHALQKRGAKVRTFDPLVPEHSTVSSLDQALKKAHAAILATDHTFFRTLSPEQFTDHGVKVLIDGRNCLPRQEFTNAGMLYKGIGR